MGNSPRVLPSGKPGAVHTLGLTAVRQGDLDIAKSLLRDAIETHPQHFDEAVRALGALEAG